MKTFNGNWERKWLNDANDYKYELLKKNAVKPQHRPSGDEAELMEAFRENPEKFEEVRTHRGKEKVYYYVPIRATKSCRDCHPRNDDE